MRSVSSVPVALLIKAELITMNFECIAVVRCSSQAILPVKNTIPEIFKKSYFMLTVFLIVL